MQDPFLLPIILIIRSSNLLVEPRDNCIILRGKCQYPCPQKFVTKKALIQIHFSFFYKRKKVFVYFLTYLNLILKSIR